MVRRHWRNDKSQWIQFYVTHQFKFVSVKRKMYVRVKIKNCRYTDYLVTAIQFNSVRAIWTRLKCHDTDASKHLSTGWLYCVECPQHSIRLEAVSYLCTSYLLPAFADAQCHVPATEWCQRYLPCYLFSVSHSVCFSSMSVSQAAQRCTGLLNIGHLTLSKIWVSFLYEVYSTEKWFWINSNRRNGN